MKTKKYFVNHCFNPLSQDGGGGGGAYGIGLIPFSLFSYCDCHSVNLPTLYPDTHVFMKNNSNNFTVKRVGEGGGTEREGVTAKVLKFS